MADQQPENEQQSSEEPANEDHDTMSEPIENPEPTSPAQNANDETNIGENTSGLVIPEEQDLEPHILELIGQRAEALAAALGVMTIAILSFVILSGVMPFSEAELQRADFSLMTPADEASLYLRYHNHQGGAGAMAAVSGPYTREEAEEEIREEFRHSYE
ncbi:hypothetical protein IWZ01DRAFT_544944 [Phyllosticta capitalensis]